MASHCMDEEAPGSGAKPTGRVGEGASPTLPPLSLKTRYGYASGAIANGVKNVSFSAYLMFFYNQVVGVPAAIVSAALAATPSTPATATTPSKVVRTSTLVMAMITSPCPPAAIPSTKTYQMYRKKCCISNFKTHSTQC